LRYRDFAWINDSRNEAGPGFLPNRNSGEVCMRRAVCAMVVLLAFLPGVATAAGLQQVRFELAFFYPPNPCTGTDLRDATLGGVAALSFRLARAGDAFEVGRGAAPVLGCAGRGAFDAEFDLPGDGTLFFSFAGSLVDGGTSYPVFAFPSSGADSAPASAPLIEIGVFSNGAFTASSSQDWPLLAFASPGQQIGTLGAHLISEPGGAALLAASLLLAVSRLRRVQAGEVRLLRERARRRLPFHTGLPVPPRAGTGKVSRTSAASERESKKCKRRFAGTSLVSSSALCWPWRSPAPPTHRHRPAI